VPAIRSLRDHQLGLAIAAPGGRAMGMDFSLTTKIYTSEMAGRFGRVASEGRPAPEISC